MFVTELLAIVDSYSLAYQESALVLLGEYRMGEDSEEATLIVMPLSVDYLGFNYIDAIASYSSIVAVMRNSQIVELGYQDSDYGHCRSTRQECKRVAQFQFPWMLVGSRDWLCVVQY